jgi:putative spermidine/putrescine transport system substrate-binding protein
MVRERCQESMTRNQATVRPPVVRQFSKPQPNSIAKVLCLWLMSSLYLLTLFGCGDSKSPPTPELPGTATWQQIQEQAQGTTVRMAMWDGDPLVNAYMHDDVAPALFKEYGVTLNTIGGQGSELVSRLVVDLEAGRTVGEIDVMWINGATFYQLREMHALYGPFTDRLPNNEYLDWKNPFIAIDFQQPVAGFECPWGNVQFALIYHGQRVTSPPQNTDELAKWIKQHPSRFTFDVSFTGMTFLKSLLYGFAGGPDSLNGTFNEELYQSASQKLWKWIRDVQPHLWRQGRTFPEGVAQLHQLFSNDEVDFTMSVNDGEVDNKVLQGVLPDAARAYVLQGGSIRNSHYLGIPVNAPHKAAALVLVNYLISPEAQLRKTTPTVWGDGTVLSLSRLPQEWRSRFENIPGRTRVAPRSELEPLALMEPAAEIMVRLQHDFRREIVDHAP